MEIQLKERLVGAIVLVLAAVLFVPMLLDGPGQGRHVSRTIELPEGAQGRRTVRIDLDKPAAGDSGEVRIDESEPAAVDLTPQQEAETATVQPEVERRPTLTMPPAKPAPEVSAPAKTTADTTSPWTVQAGSFSQQANAQALADKLRALGFPASVTRFQDRTGTHYRVRVGGFPTRDAAQQRADEIRRKTGGPATPVPNE